MNVLSFHTGLDIILVFELEVHFMSTIELKQLNVSTSPLTFRCFKEKKMYLKGKLRNFLEDSKVKMLNSAAGDAGDQSFGVILPTQVIQFQFGNQQTNR